MTHLGFGSETGSLPALRAFQRAEPDAEKLRQGLAKGMTLARARSEATPLSATLPNDTLAVEYLRAIEALGAAIEPVVIPREGSGYHDELLSALPSATAVRKAARGGETLHGAIPETVLRLLSDDIRRGEYQREDGLDTALLYALRTMSKEALSAVIDVGEGLEMRILRAAQMAPDREALLTIVKCKRYTYARLSRTLTQAMLGMTKDLVGRYAAPSYARLLGFRKDAGPLMAAIAREASVPIVTRAAPFRRQGNPVFLLDLRAASLWPLGCLAPETRAGARELTEPIRIISSP